MTDAIANDIRNQVRRRLQMKGREDVFGDESSLFVSGLLDSLAMLHLIVYIEKLYGIDFDLTLFDPEELDTVNQLVRFIVLHQASMGENTA